MMSYWATLKVITTFLFLVLLNISTNLEHPSYFLEKGAATHRKIIVMTTTWDNNAAFSFVKLALKSYV